MSVPVASLPLAQIAASGKVGSLPTFTALANEISVKTEDERRHCGLVIRRARTNGGFRESIPRRCSYSRRQGALEVRDPSP